MRTLVTSLCLGAGLMAAAPAAAQYGAHPVGSDPPPARGITSKSAGRSGARLPTSSFPARRSGSLGSDVDFVNNLGIEKATFTQFKLVLRPATKHKFRFEYTPISYEAEKTVTRTFVFNGQRYNIGLPVTSELKWKAYRFAYEWDFLYRDRGFLGMLLEAKYTDINATLSTAFAGVTDVEFAHARAPIPAIGFIGRVLPGAQHLDHRGVQRLQVPLRCRAREPGLRRQVSTTSTSTARSTSPITSARTPATARSTCSTR